MAESKKPLKWWHVPVAMAFVPTIVVWMLLERFLPEKLRKNENVQAILFLIGLVVEALIIRYIFVKGIHIQLEASEVVIRGIEGLMGFFGAISIALSILTFGLMLGGIAAEEKAEEVARSLGPLLALILGVDAFFIVLLIVRYVIR